MNFTMHAIDPGNTTMASVSVSLTALGPVLMVVVLRKLHKLGWSNAGLSWSFRRNKSWYLLGAAYTPALVGLVAAAGLLIGLAEVSGERSAAITKMSTMFAALLIPMFAAAVGEEFGWRGFMEPALADISDRLFLNHVVVGIVWGLWHFPILIYAPGNEVTLLQLSMVLVGCIGLALVYGQMRLRSGSVWPCVLLHGLSNVTIIAIGSSELLEFNPATKDLISLNSTSLAITGAWLFSGLLVFWINRNKGIER